MPIDTEKIQRFIDSRDTRASVASVVRRAGFVISWVREYKSRDLWGFYLKPTRSLRDLFGISQEILLWVSEFPEFQPRALSQAQDIINEEQPRLCDDFAIILSADSDTTDQVMNLTQQTQQQFVGFSLGQIEEFQSSKNDQFIFAIQRQFFTKDLYNVTNVITTRRAFFGREALVQEIRNVLLTGASHVAIFGIRKMGKTSLLFRLIEEMGNSSEICIAHLDMQRLDAVRPTAEYFLWSIGEHLYSGNAAVRKVSNLRLFGCHARFPAAIDSAVLLEDFDHDMRLIITTTSIKVILMIDEIELMSPETLGSGWGDSYVRAWRLLRGIDQTHPQHLRFLITGTNPRCIEANALGGKENPTYNYFGLRFLKPLKAEESNTLLATIGSRMGLEWESEALCRAHDLVGGHPLLLRQLGSAVHDATAPRNDTTVVTGDLVQSLVSQFTSRVSSSLSQMVEVLADSYPDELMLLKTLAVGRLGEFEQYAAEFPNEVSHLRGYGLLPERPSQERISIEILQSWLQQRGTNAPRPTPRLETGAFSIRDVIDSYRIEAMLGKPGGFGCVYKARWREASKIVALKVFHEASLEQLEREVDVLKGIRHPGVVSILDHGKFSTGHVYLTMELLNGSTLHSYCNRAQRFNSDRTLLVLRRLLEALIAIHPNDEKVRELRKKERLTTDEFRQLTRAMDGYVHRDINPNNIIILESGDPVLIDFGISSKVNTRVVTDSGTRGYRPPDGPDVTWTVDTDLYALGLTIAQCLTGIELTPDGVDDLRNAVKGEKAGIVGDVVLRLCAPRRAERYETAAEALRDLGVPSK